MEQTQRQADTTEENPAGTRLVVIARDERAVRSTVAFLNRRGIPTNVVTNLNDAIEMFSKKQANMALLSVNYPHQKIEMIPSLLTQSFDVDTIIFAEDTDRKTTHKLGNTKARHVLFGPVSGPVVLMRVRQIEKENSDSTVAAASVAGGEAASEENASEDSGAIKVGGGKGNHADRISVKSKKRKVEEADAVAALKTLADEEEQSYDPGASLERSGQMIIQKGTRSSMKSATQSGPMDKTRRSELASRAFGRAIDKGLTTPSTAKKPKLFIPPPPWTAPERQAELEAREEEELSLELDEARTSELSATEESRKSREQKAGERTQKASEQREIELAKREEKRSQKARESEGREHEASQQIEKRNREAMIRDDSSASRGSAGQDAVGDTAPMSAMQAGVESKTKSATAGAAAPAPSSARIEPVKLREPKTRKEELFFRCLKEALSTVCGEPIGVKVGISKVRAAGLVSVRSQKVEGAFVIEVGRSRLNPQDYLQRIEVAFFSILRRSGIDLQQGEQFAIELEDLDIVEKAVEASDYMLISSSPDHEVAAAVVPVSRPFPTIEPHENKMLKVLLQDLPIDVPVTFDVFLRLPTNQKYLRYLKIGSKMSGKQSTKLGRYSVSHMFLNESDRDAYRKHYAAQSIDPTKKGDKSA